MKKKPRGKKAQKQLGFVNFFFLVRCQLPRTAGFSIFFFVFCFFMGR